MNNIKLKNFEIEVIVGLLTRKDSLLNSDNKPLSISVLWKIDSNLNILSAIAQNIQKMRERIMSKYNTDVYSYEEKNEDGEFIGRKIKPEYFSVFNKELTDLLQIDNEVRVDTISIKDIEDIKLVGQDFSSIKFMLEKIEDEDENIEE